MRKQTSEVSEVDEDVDSNAEVEEGVKESKANEKLLKRLYKAAERDIQ